MANSSSAALISLEVYGPIRRHLVSILRAGIARGAAPAWSRKGS